jgi:5-methylcytosine-specific restriction protein B
MNSVDRNVALVDYALRRRFGFLRVSPDANVIASLHASSPTSELASTALSQLNGWLARRLDEEHTIGHSFFINPAIDLDQDGALDRIWQLDLKPLLEEYFFGDSDSLKEAAKVWREAIASALEEAVGEPDATDQTPP